MYWTPVGISRLLQLRLWFVCVCVLFGSGFITATMWETPLSPLNKLSCLGRKAISLFQVSGRKICAAPAVHSPRIKHYSFKRKVGTLMVPVFEFQFTITVITEILVHLLFTSSLFFFRQRFLLSTNLVLASGNGVHTWCIHIHSVGIPGARVKKFMWIMSI